MAKVYGFNEAGYRRVVEATRRVLKRPRTGAQRRRREPVLTGGNATGNGQNNCGCGCVIRQADDPQEIAGEVCGHGPDFWEFDVGEFNCGCDAGSGDNGEGGTVKLYFVAGDGGRDIWRSTPALVCPTDILPNSLECAGICDCSDYLVCGYERWRLQSVGEPPVPALVLIGDGCDGDAGCGLPSGTDGDGQSLAEFMATVDPLTLGWPLPTDFVFPCFGEVQTDPCWAGQNICYESTVTGGVTTWTQIFGPDPMETSYIFYNPNAHALQAPASGIQLCVPGCDPSLTQQTAYSYWELSVAPVGSYGDNATRLTFKVAGCPVIEYRLPWGACFQCVSQNPMEIVPCGPYPCNKPPSYVCLIAR